MPWVWRQRHGLVDWSESQRLRVNGGDSSLRNSRDCYLGLNWLSCRLFTLTVMPFLGFLGAGRLVMARFAGRRSLVVLFVLMFVSQCWLSGQTGRSSLAGSVKDAAGAILQGARIDLEPTARPAVTDEKGEFLLRDLQPGTYQVSVSFVGFDTTTTSVTLLPGQTAHVQSTLKVASNKQEIAVFADREYGEADAVNRTRAAENILQVLPAEVITSLPNANIADALGRMPSVTIERDEGEGKYVQIRGTEPRLSNTMVDGVSIPSPESGVRQIKLDTIASDLVDSVEINKTLQANIDADGIGGSVNLVDQAGAGRAYDRDLWRGRVYPHSGRSHGGSVWDHDRTTISGQQETGRAAGGNV